MEIDVENIVFKVYNHFSILAIRTAQFSEFVEVVSCNILQHGVTSWFCLLPAIDRILKCLGIPIKLFPQLR